MINIFKDIANTLLSATFFNPKKACQNGERFKQTSADGKRNTGVTLSHAKVPRNPLFPAEKRPWSGDVVPGRAKQSLYLLILLLCITWTSSLRTNAPRAFYIFKGNNLIFSHANSNAMLLYSWLGKNFILYSADKCAVAMLAVLRAESLYFFIWESLPWGFSMHVNNKLAFSRATVAPWPLCSWQGGFLILYSVVTCTVVMLVSV